MPQKKRYVMASCHIRWSYIQFNISKKQNRHKRHTGGNVLGN